MSQDWEIIHRHDLERGRPSFEQSSARHGGLGYRGRREKSFTGHYHVDIGWGRWKMRIYEINWTISGQDSGEDVCGCSLSKERHSGHEGCGEIEAEARGADRSEHAGEIKAYHLQLEAEDRKRAQPGSMAEASSAARAEVQVVSGDQGEGCH